MLVIRDQARLDPYIIENFDDDNGKITLRVLARRVELDGRDSAPANELVYTHRFISVKPRRIDRYCHVRVFAENERVVTPYDRNGGGDCFFIRMEEVVDSGELTHNTSPNIRESSQSPTPRPCYIPLKTAPKNLRQGFLLDTETPASTLKGLDLFCGGGNFGRGMEEGGAVEMKFAVDIESVPLHAYRANLQHPDDAAMYLGSINNYLKDAITGKYSKTVTSPDPFQ